MGSVSGLFVLTGAALATASLLVPIVVRPARATRGDADIDREMTNLCRCATYARIRAAIQLAARRR